MRVTVAQIGARRHYAVACGLQSQDALDVLITDACARCPPWSWLARLPATLHQGGLPAILSRTPHGIPDEKLRSKPAFFFRYRLGRRNHRSSPWPSDQWAAQNADFCQTIGADDLQQADTVYAYNGAALELFETAKRLGLRRLLDQTAASWRFNTELLRREQQQWPDWERFPGDLDHNGKMIEREEREWELADRIICGSQFVVDTIHASGGPVEKCRVVPYPTPAAPALAGGTSRPSTGRFHILFAGTLQLRKGIQYLCKAASQLPDDQYEVRVIGPNNLSSRGTASVQRGLDWRGRVPRSAVWQHYLWADAFILPTLSEGSANVCHEALSMGVPVITTPASGIADESALVRQLPAANDAAIVEALERLRAEPPPREPVVAPQRSVADYGRDLVGAIVDKPIDTTSADRVNV
ncbi:MAG: glycosyltransferase family 4 protein [Candidatus Paceibacterota bacterium]